MKLADDLDLSFDDRGRGHGRPILLLHGGAGPRSMLPFADALAADARVVTPTHPGFNGTPRPSWFDSVGDLALAYAELLDTLDLRDVLVIGNSLGGWIAAELALRAPARLGGIVLLNATGIAVDGHPVANVAGLPPAELAALAYHDPARFKIDPATLTPELLAILAGNRATMAVYGAGEHDAKLRRRLGRVTVPALVAWGESDRIVDVDYGRAYAAAFAHGRFAPIAEAAHFPQLEQPAKLRAIVDEFTASLVARAA